MELTSPLAFQSLGVALASFLSWIPSCTPLSPDSRAPQPLRFDIPMSCLRFVNSPLLRRFSARGCSFPRTMSRLLPVQHHRHGSPAFLNSNALCPYLGAKSAALGRAGAFSCLVSPLLHSQSSVSLSHFYVFHDDLVSCGISLCEPAGRCHVWRAKTLWRIWKAGFFLV